MLTCFLYSGMKKMKKSEKCSDSAWLICIPRYFEPGYIYQYPGGIATKLPCISLEHVVSFEHVYLLHAGYTCIALKAFVYCNCEKWQT